MFLVFASGTVPSPAHGLPCCQVRASGWTVALSWKVPSARQVAVAAEPLSSGVHESPFSLSFSASAAAGPTSRGGPVCANRIARAAPPGPAAPARASAVSPASGLATAARARPAWAP